MLEKKEPEGIIDPSQLSPRLTRTHTPWAVTCEITATLVRFVSEELYQLLNAPWRQVRRHGEAAVKREAPVLREHTSKPRAPHVV